MPLALLEGRTCGACTACCEFPPIRSERLQKPSNTLCPHCERGAGCTAYQVRPRECRGFYCGWFFLPGLPDDWHPAQSGVVIRPEGFDDDEITVLVMRRSAFLLSESFAGMVGAWVNQGLGVNFELPGPPGHLPAKMRVNEVLEEAIAAQDLREMHKLFAWALAYIESRHVWERDNIVLESQLS